MRIAQLANFYGPRSGGLRTAVDQLGAGYAARGHRCLTIVPAARARWVDLGSRARLELRGPALPHTGGYRLLARPSLVLRAIERFRPDVVELSDQTTLTALLPRLRARRIPVVLFAHERLDVRFARSPTLAWTGGLLRRHVRRLTDRCDAVVVCSRYAAAGYEGAPVPVVTIPLGVDLATFRPVPDAGRAPGGPLRLVCISRLHEEKQPELAIDTLAELHRRGVHAHLTVIGDGPLRRALGRRAMGLPVSFAGHLARPAEVASLTARADLALACGPIETFGLGALEALACGVAVVATDRGGVGEVVGSAGRVAAPAADRFADAVLQLAGTDPSERRARARCRAEAFTWAGTTDRLLELFHELAGR